MKYITAKYALYRGRFLSRKYCQRFFTFVRLPELKFLKTCGFILSILL